MATTVSARNTGALKWASLTVFLIGFFLHMGWIFISGLTGPIGLWLMAIGAALAFVVGYSTSRWIGAILFLLGLVLYTGFLVTNISLDFIDIRGIELDENFWMMILGYIVLFFSAR